MAAEEGRGGWPCARPGRPAPAPRRPRPRRRRDPDDGDVVEGGPGPGDALAVGGPATPAGDLLEPDGEAEGYAVAGEGEDLVADAWCRDTSHSPQAASARSSMVRVRRWGGCRRPGVGGGEGHPAGVGAGEGAALERLGDQPAGVDHPGLDAPGEDGADAGCGRRRRRGRRGCW